MSDSQYQALAKNITDLSGVLRLVQGNAQVPGGMAALSAALALNASTLEKIQMQHPDLLQPPRAATPIEQVIAATRARRGEDEAAHARRILAAAGITVSDTTSTAQLHKAVSIAALTFHPDKNPGQEVAAGQAFSAIQDAAAVLSGTPSAAESWVPDPDPPTPASTPPQSPRRAATPLFSAHSADSRRGSASSTPSETAPAWAGRQWGAANRVTQDKLKTLLPDGATIKRLAPARGKPTEYTIVGSTDPNAQALLNSAIAKGQVKPDALIATPENAPRTRHH
jgi:hypothetical protein